MNDGIVHESLGYGTIDAACLRRRAEIRETIAGHRAGEPLPHVGYTGEEDALWREVMTELHRLHPSVACGRYLRAAERMPLPVGGVPSLASVSGDLRARTGFELLPAEDLVPAREFYAAFADGRFSSTMYLRCPAVPLYSPDPDVLHELVGHAVMLGDPLFADLYRLFGETVRRVRAPDTVQAISKVFWFTMETGLVDENGEPRAYGAALLSSAGELQSIPHVTLRPFSIAEMIRQPYDIYQYQPMLFVVESIDVLAAELRAFLRTRR
ncbi:Phenylalanine-4-hydroxylase [Actinomadura rubteroloni]|uniref:Phenylalanine-4-hydroxylase n=1 Tax=Actinomadura rubteroloni TaxID=1926885 RepID=A0A2P4ULH4_9ACTN|nr:amino acid hydroxylase [Actinomadura rubteroloni]POM25902.1 Phenylalanine-4-hydroxylase [Actinomadura rubteroloni]